jgi:hypothetical protein
MPRLCSIRNRRVSRLMESLLLSRPTENPVWCQQVAFVTIVGYIQLLCSLSLLAWTTKTMVYSRDGEDGMDKMRRAWCYSTVGCLVAVRRDCPSPLLLHSSCMRHHVI